MCEGIKDNSPKNRAIVFSATIGRVYCFTTFDPVPEKTVIYHKWYFRSSPLRPLVGQHSAESSFGMAKRDRGVWK
jgi:hypothetical protein